MPKIIKIDGETYPKNRNGMYVIVSDDDLNELTTPFSSLEEAEAELSKSTY